MANWCENVVTITAPDEATARAFFEALRAGDEFLGEKNPICTEPGVPATGEDADVAEWTGEYRAVEGRMWINGAQVEMSWASRWEPPTAWYDVLTRCGFEVDAMYLETGMCFCGFYCDGEQQNVEYETRADIPAEIEAEWGSDLFDWLFEDEGEGEGDA